MNFKIGTLYRVVNSYKECIGCIFRYEGTHSGTGDHYGTPVKLGRICKENDSSGCTFEFQRAIDTPHRYKMVEHIDMVKFCKELRSKREKENKV